MSSVPPRKFAPVPVEETTKSSRKKVDTAEPSTKPRRFAPEPVEQTTRSSKDVSQPTADLEKPKPRRFAPQAVEHTVKSSKDAHANPPEQDAESKPRRFAPQLVDESQKSSKEPPQPDKEPHVKFKPEPIATTHSTKRRGKRHDTPTESSNGEDEGEKRPPRKFTPILLDTASRSRRAGDPNAPISQDYRTEYGYHAHHREHWRRVNGEVTPSVVSEQERAGDAMDVDQTSSISNGSSKRRRVSPLDGSPPTRARCLQPQRTHSFRMPDLDTIESSESDGDSDASSVPATPAQEGSPITVSDSYELFKHATRRRESTDETWQHYLLDLERKKAQERLEEQALAAFPNADFGYEHPHHYFNDDDDGDDYEIEDRPVTWDGNEDDLLKMARRESTVNMSWEKGEMQRHAERIQQERDKSSAQQPTPSPFMKLDVLMGAAEADSELKSMRDRARPPMLGQDLVFPRCTSPDPARFDVTQGSTALRNQMCYLTAAADAERQRSGEEEGLWRVSKPENKRISTVKDSIGPGSPSSKGLWGGFCINDGKHGAGFGASAAQPTGLMTPKHDAPNPFHEASGEIRSSGRMTPDKRAKNSSRTDLHKLNAILVTEQQIDTMMEHEYPDSFITQVYNYLSLGYPSLARPFDDELSKISRIPVPELRQDDEKARATPRGYIRLGPDFEGGGGEGMSEDSCMRWRALKRYIREWAKQEKNWAPGDGVGGNWGTGARRGSWAI